MVNLSSLTEAEKQILWDALEEYKVMIECAIESKEEGDYDGEDDPEQEMTDFHSLRQKIDWK